MHCYSGQSISVLFSRDFEITGKQNGNPLQSVNLRYGKTGYACYNSWIYSFFLESLGIYPILFVFSISLSHSDSRRLVSF